MIVGGIGTFMWNRILTFLGYLYLLRVPLLIWIAIMFMFAGSFAGGVGEPILRGLFDVASFTYSLLGLIFRFAFVTLTALLAGTAMWVTSRVIIANAHDRLGITPVRMTLGLEFLVRFLPLLAVLLVLARTLILSAPSLSTFVRLSGKTLGVILGAVVWYIFTILTQYLAEKRRDAKVVYRWEGYVNAQGSVYIRQTFAKYQWFVSIVAYFLYLVLSLIFESLALPTFSLVFLLLTLICWSLAGLSFFLDRYRIPLLLIIVVWGFIAGKFRQGDHFYEALPLTGASAADSQALGSDVLRSYLEPATDERVVLVATTGGGIQATAWTARVLTGLSQEIPTFDQRLAVVSSVSGGSIGTMYFVDAYDNGGIPEKIKNQALDENPIVKRAETSSIDDVTWGLIYPDLGFGLLPFIKGLGFEDRHLHLVDGPLIFTDRGLTLEDSWKQRLSDTKRETLLSDWRKDVRQHRRPAIIFNSTLAETGERLLLSTTDFDSPVNSPNKSDLLAGRLEFFRRFDADLRIQTAARLSATFPYVSPATRLLRNFEQPCKTNCPPLAGLYDPQPHAIDGGYYDNYGMATLLDWLDAALQKLEAERQAQSGKGRPPRILIIEIRASPTETDPSVSDSYGFFFQLIHPLEALWNVNQTGQLSHNALDEDLVKRLYSRENVCSVVFEFKNVDDRGCPQSKPLNWHLTPTDIHALQRVWKSTMVKQVEKAKRFWEKGECLTEEQ